MGPLTGGRMNNVHIAMEKLASFRFHNGFIHLNVFHFSVQPPFTLLLLQFFLHLHLCPYCLFFTSIFHLISSCLNCKTGQMSHKTSTFQMSISSRFITSLHLLKGHNLALTPFYFHFILKLLTRTSLCVLFSCSSTAQSSQPIKSDVIRFYEVPFHYHSNNKWLFNCNNKYLRCNEKLMVMNHQGVSAW